MAAEDVQDVHIDNLQKKYDDLKQNCEKMEERLRALEISHAALSTRLTLFQLAQATYTTIGSIIGTVVGAILGATK